jgi:hypothetical protein
VKQYVKLLKGKRLQSDLYSVVPLVINKFILLFSGQHQFQRLDKGLRNVILRNVIASYIIQPVGTEVSVR